MPYPLGDAAVNIKTFIQRKTLAENVKSSIYRSSTGNKKHTLTTWEPTRKQP